jgi:hypothetical protein
MPIDPDFPKNHQAIGKHKLAGGEHFHFVWGPGRSDAETSRGFESILQEMLGKPLKNVSVTPTMFSFSFEE